MTQSKNQTQPEALKAAKVWFLTGTSRGFGRIWAEAALQRGDKVAATARNIDSIAGLKDKYGDNVLTLPLDVTRSEQVKSAVETAYKHFGQLDIVFNNAGYSLVGAIEEAQPDVIRAQYETNVLGSVAVIQAALPFLRRQGCGHILGTSSSLGHLAYPLIGYYCSSKWAFEAIHESLAVEVKPFGIKVTIIEPGAYATEFGSPESLKFSDTLPAYDNLREQMMAQLKTQVRSNPKATPEAIFKVVDAENPPLRLFLGSHNLPEVREIYSKRLQEWEAWKEVSDAAQE